MGGDSNATQRFRSFAEFYPFYLNEHATAACRRMHFLGTFLVLALMARAAATRRWRQLWGLPVAGYGCAWAGHFFFEKNKPATFKYPVYSLIGDFVLFADILRGRVSV